MFINCDACSIFVPDLMLVGCKGSDIERAVYNFLDQNRLEMKRLVNKPWADFREANLLSLSPCMTSQPDLMRTAEMEGKRRGCRERD